MKSPAISGVREARGDPSREGRQTLLGGCAAGLLSTVIVSRCLTATDAAVSGETLWIAQLTFAALLVWALSALQTGGWRLHFDGLDAGVALLCLGHVIGSLVVLATGGDLRAAMTMLWEWAAIAVTFFLLRQFFASAAIRRSLVLTVAAFAVALSGLGLWQHHFGYSATREIYQRMKTELAALESAGPPTTPQAAVDRIRQRQKLLAEFARTGIPTSDSARMLWEQRLMSSEPIGLFALANTLAGFIAPALVLWLSSVIPVDRGTSRWGTVAGVVSIAIVADCLILTKSRTAFVGLFAGLAAWWTRSGRSRSAASPGVRRGLFAGAVASVALLVGTWLSGGLDRYVVTESSKSLRYRIEYWTATCRMLADSPRNWLLGVGPGNFRQNYLPFKLPESSEEIADPHNVILDVWSNAGLLGLAGLAGICFAMLRPLWRRPPGAAGPSPETAHWNRWILFGGGLACLCVVGPDFENDELLSLLSLLLLGWLLVAWLCHPLFVREPTAIVFASAGIVLLVHLLGAGGMGMPAISQTLLLLAALASIREAECARAAAEDTGPLPPANSPQPLLGDPPGRLAPQQSIGGRSCPPDALWPAAAIGLLAVALSAGCWLTGLSPVLTARAWIASGQHALLDLRRSANAERDFLRAAAADRWSAEPAGMLSQLYYQRAFASTADRDAELGRSLEWQQEAIARNPRLAGEHRLLGELYLSIFTQSRRMSDASSAADAFQQAISLYPHHALTQSELAEALWKCGRTEEARLAAQQAQLLDSVNEQAGHIDKRLPPDRRELMARILHAAESNPN